MNIDEMIFGEYYKVFLEGSDRKSYTIIQYKDIADNGNDRNRIIGPMVSNMDSNAGEFYYKKSSRLYITKRETVPATPEEIAWLNACIAADKLVDKQLTGVIPDVISKPSLKHTDIREDEYYYIKYDGKDDDWAIIKCDSRDDDYRWTGPTITSEEGELEFQDGSEDEHGAYFGGDPDEDDRKVEVRYATRKEIAWLNECINEGELVKKPNPIRDTKIWIGDDITLRRKVQEKLNELGAIDAFNSAFDNAYALYVDSDMDVSYSSKRDGREYFDDQGSREITLADLGIVEDHRTPVEILTQLKAEVEDLLKVKTAELENNGEEIPEYLKKFLTKPKTGTMDKYITQLTADMVGTHVKCRIDGKKISEALVLAESGEYYLCQDVVDGTSKFKNKGGYKYTYNCGNGTAQLLQDVNVTAMERIEKVGKFKVGDWVILEKSEKDTGWVNSMDKYNGRIARITKEKERGVFILDVDKGNFSWSDESFKESGTISLKPTDLVKGEIYVYTGDTPQDHIFRSGETGKDRGHCDIYMKPSERYYSSSGGGLGTGPFRTCTPKEKLHLLACIEAKKYVDPPKEEENKQAIDIDPDVLIQMILNNQ